jgi:ATP-dependent Clp protease ATP-binding subunit ClpB
VLRIRFDFFAQAADVNIHAARSDEALGAPDGIEQLIAREDAIGTGSEKIEQTKFEGAHGHGLAGAGDAVQLDPARRSVESRDFEAGLRRKIVGQDEAVQAVVDLYQVFRAGLNSPGRPVGNLLFLGPTGSGQDARRRGHGGSAVRRSARGDQGRLRGVPALARDCEIDRFASGIFGAPRDASADHAGSARAISHREAEDQLLLFDEIEKASDALWQLLLGILDKATLTLGDNRSVDLSQTMIFMTSNLGGGEITELMTGGWDLRRCRADAGRPGREGGEDGTEAAKRKFAPEFMNRIDKTVVFHPLRSAQLEQILEIELGMVQQRVLETAKGRFLFRVTQPAGNFCCAKGRT